MALVPVLNGALRVSELASGATVTAANARFFDAPIPIVAHIVGSTLYLLLGAAQFVPSLRQQRWHRYAGRVLVPAGLISALSGIWMAITYEMPESNGTSLAAVRVIVGALMVAGLVIGLLAIRRRNVRVHRAWMIRAYAIALGAGTQVFTFLPWTLALGMPGTIMTTVLMTAGWAINMVIAEIVIRRSARR
ncbi:DUF2306 domain-containing protein [Ruania halotolerans]|uniref:DUF2306 domain-containing protein n=1 Tax=Ruania halotolerans TaxID=2897773 RepID=UPI001E5D8C02|nr:DUF2306 domain-containing protein [Ruania halotolerans]UFU05074.1 DUF2306 domain-containing protein [Ruania halotolerans]